MISSDEILKSIEKLEKLPKEEVIKVVHWTLIDLHNACNSENYSSLDQKVKNWCAMLEEAVVHQINKAERKYIGKEEE